MACELHIAMSQNSSCCTQVFRLAWNWSHLPHRRGSCFWPRPGKGRIEVLRIIKTAWRHSFLIFSFSLQPHPADLFKFDQIELSKPNHWILKAFYVRPGRVEPYRNTHTEQRIAKLVQTSGCNPPGPRVAQSLCLPSKRRRRGGRPGGAFHMVGGPFFFHTKRLKSPGGFEGSGSQTQQTVLRGMKLLSGFLRPLRWTVAPRTLPFLGSGDFRSPRHNRDRVLQGAPRKSDEKGQSCLYQAIGTWAETAITNGRFFMYQFDISGGQRISFHSLPNEDSELRWWFFTLTE